MIELLNELRVVLPGVQVLFAFLLTVPFSNGFPEMSSLQRDVYFVSFVCATVATLILIAPTKYHRLQCRQGSKERILFDSNTMLIAGTAFLALAMAAAVFVITDVLFYAVAAGIAAGVAAASFVALW